MTTNPKTAGILATPVTRVAARLAPALLLAGGLAQAAPTVTLTATPATVAYGGSTTLAWSSAGAANCSIPWGSTATAGRYTTPALFSSNTFTITCYGADGSTQASAVVTVAGPPPPPTVTLVADPPTVPFNATSTLSWASTDALSCNTPWGATATGGSTVTPPITYDRGFTVTCSGHGGSKAADVTVRVGSAVAPAPAPTVTLSADPASIAHGATTTLRWRSTNATACSTPWGATAIGGSSATGPLTASTTYTISCTGSGGSRSASVTVAVAAAPPPLPAPAPPTVTLDASPSSVAHGATATLAWASTGASACTTPWGATATAGSFKTPALTASTRYTVSCSGPGGSSSAGVTVDVAAAPPSTPAPTPTPSGVTATISAAASTVAYGASTTLTWSSANATHCSIPWGSSATAGSTATPELFGPTTYTITCYGPAGSRSASTTVAVGPPPPAPKVTLTATPATVAAGGAVVLTWSSTDARSCNTPWGATATGGSHTTPPVTYEQSFTVTCSGHGGSGSAVAAVRIGAAPAPVTPPPPPPPAAPTVSLTADPASVAHGASTTLTWSASNASACTTPWGATATSGSSTTPALTATTTYAVQCSGAGGSGSASVTVVVAAAPATPPPPSAGADVPVVFNATVSARAGDLVSLQGENFGDAPVVTLESAPGVPLEIVNRVGTGWLAVQLPADARGALTVRIRNGSATSAPVKLNAALPLHLDAIQLVPGGAFRVFGRNLLLAGSVPIVRVDGLVAGVDLAHSDEHMLSVTAPAALAPTAVASIAVDNGNGSGAAVLDRRIEVVAAPHGGDPFALGVGWAAGFAEFAGRTVDAAGDARLAQKAACDGARDDTAAIAQAVRLASDIGGAVVRLPAGRCRLAGGVPLASRVVLQGAGKAATELVYEANYPLHGQGLDLVGIRQLAIRNAGPAREGPLLKQSTRVFLQDVAVRIGTSSQLFLDGNRNAVVQRSDFVQTGSVSHQGPYILNGSAGLVFEGNTTRWVDGAPAFGRVQDAVVVGNRFTRDAAAQHLPGTVHSLTIDFAHRIAVVGNTFDVVNGPITNTTRNDGETILSEAGGAQRTENLGTVASAGATTLTDPQNTLVADPFGEGWAPENHGIAIVGGKGAGQTRRLMSYAAPTATVDRPWDVLPDATSRYASFVWGLEKSLIKGNTLLGNPRGIWLYHAAVRDVEIVGNTIAEGGGIYLRSYQNLATKSFMPIYNVRIAGNRIGNTEGRWMSHINAVFVNADARAWGIANLGISVSDNRITANLPNRSSQTEEYAGTEGYMAMMRVETYGNYEPSAVPRMLGTLFSRNVCTNCEVGVRTGAGAGGTTVVDSALLGCPVVWDDWATTGTGERSAGTVVR